MEKQIIKTTSISGVIKDFQYIANQMAESSLLLLLLL